MRCAPSIALAAALCAMTGAERPRYFDIRIVPARQDIEERLCAGDLAGACGIVDRELARASSANADPLLYYTGACVSARLGKRDEAAQRLLDAVKAGFKNFSRMRRDPDLAPVHDHPIYQTLLRARDAADGLLAQRALSQWRVRLDSGAYHEDRDDKHRLQFLAAIDADELKHVRAAAGELFDRLSAVMFDQQHLSWAIIVLPGVDEKRLIDRHGVAGVYRHELGELIALDTGTALRHELVHVLHHRHMDAIGQQHPIWIQEGLAMLWEDSGTAAGGALQALAADRHNLAKRLLRDGRMMPLEQLFRLPEAQFNAMALQTYAQVHAVLRFLAEHWDISRWYRAYVEDFQSDGTGVGAIETITGWPLPEFETQWRRWLEEQAFIVRQDHAAPRTD